MKYYLGIDPGLSGALAFYDPTLNVLKVFDMPVHENIKVNGKRKRKIDLHELANIIDDFSSNTVKAIVEEVSAMPGQGVSSMFSFGFSAGCAQMAVVACAIPIVLESPGRWKKAMGISKDKEGARREASRLMPSHSGNWNLKKHDGRAEAALMAYYLSVKERVGFEELL